MLGQAVVVLMSLRKTDGCGAALIIANSARSWFLGFEECFGDLKIVAHPSISLCAWVIQHAAVPVWFAFLTASCKMMLGYHFLYRPVWFKGGISDMPTVVYQHQIRRRVSGF